ncbi:peptidoglycan bridge formation glycyltransferase FemA/FemB family protein [Patescibacteria group bacterium]|nr:peptidoglycan bridge formation glycyltransferase FemA/FemB family protein [Patescibacteria group bacterium]
MALDRRSWDAAASHPLQTWAWGEFRRSMGIDVVRLVPDHRLSEVWQITFHHIPYTHWTIGYFPKGPVPTPRMFRELEKLGRKKHAIFIQLEPNVQVNNITIKQFNNVLFKQSHHPLFTKYSFILDLTKTEEELLAAMHPKTRYNIRLAQKRGVVIKEDSSQEAFEQYLTLMSETTGRQQFHAHDEAYHRRMWNIMHKSGIARLFTASYEGSTLAAWIIFSWRDTIYYPYGTSRREHRDVMAPNLLLWEIARWAKHKGFKYFDLWGALGPSASRRTDDPWYGFHRFKQGYSPRLVEYIGSYDLVIHPLLYKLYVIADALRWRYLHFKKKL